MNWLNVDQAARIVLNGGVIAYPTEAVYGIGCLPDDADAVDRILRIKRRDAGKGLIVIAAEIDQLSGLADLPEGRIGAAMKSDWPGPVTWVVPAHPGTSPLLTGYRSTIAVRVSDHPIVQRLCRRTGSALVSTSANYSGQTPARTALAVRRRLGPELDFVLAGPTGNLARPTTIRHYATGEVLRQG